MKYKVLFGLCLSFGLFCAGFQTVQAATLTVQNSAPLTSKGHHFTIFTLSGVNYAIVAAGDIAIYQLSDTAAPVLLGSYATTGTANDVIVSSDDHTAYVADGSTTTQSTGRFGGTVTTVTGHVLILDITNLAAPTLQGDYTANLGNFTALALNGTTLFAADSVNGVHSINISNPAAPTATAINSSYLAANSLAFDGTNLYILEPVASTLAVMNATNPASLTLVTTLVVATSANQVKAQGTNIYLQNGDNGLYLYDMSTATTPKLVGTYNTPGSVQGVTGNQGLGFIADNTGGVVVVNAQDVSHITPIATSTDTALESAHDIAYVGKYIYVLTDSALDQVALNFTFTVKGSKDGKVGNVTVSDNGVLWKTIPAYTSSIGAQAVLADVNNDGQLDVITAPVTATSKPKLEVFNIITGALMAKINLSSSSSKLQFTIGAGNYYSTNTQSEILATQLTKDSASKNVLNLFAYFYNSSKNSLQLKTSYQDIPTLSQFVSDGYKIKVNTSKSYPVYVQDKNSSSIYEQYKFVKNSDGTYSFKKKS